MSQRFSLWLFFHLCRPLNRKYFLKEGKKLNKNYLVYPCKVMRITQNCSGTVSHLPHTKGFPSDYPIDEGCEDGKRSYLYCPCDEMKITRIYGVGNRGTNTLWLESTSPVVFADGSEDYFTMLVTHPDDSDLKKLRAGQIFTRGEKICREGKDGASANHLHISGGKGKFKGNGWIKNSKGKWVLTVTGRACRPESLFFIDTDFTRVVDRKNISFRTLPEKGYTEGNYRVTASLLNVRKSPSTRAEKLTFGELTEDAQRKILALSGKEKNGYVKGLAFTALEIKSNWGRTPSGWVCLDYCEAI